MSWKYIGKGVGRQTFYNYKAVRKKFQIPHWPKSKGIYKYHSIQIRATAYFDKASENRS
ncbi:MAG TPA: hypothetical protein VJ184_16345 [Chryseolinea sp.]|nr:hypothetical protein [Chryseolinea sp.]